MEFKPKTTIGDFKSAPLVITADGEDVTLTILSAASRQFKEAYAKHDALIQHIKTSGAQVFEEVEVIAGGKTIKQLVKSRVIAKSEAEMISALVLDWPFDDDLVEALMKQPVLFEAIDDLANQLFQELTAAKKT